MKQFWISSLIILGLCAGLGGLSGEDPQGDLASELNFHSHPGRHSKKSPVVGTRAHELKLVQAKRQQDSILVELEKAIYQSEFIYLIPPEKKDQADAVAKRLFTDYLSRYSPHGVHANNAVRWLRTGTPGIGSNKTFIHDLENQWNTWSVEAVVEERHGAHNEKHGGYLPPHIVAYHEFMHVEETAPGQDKADFAERWNGCELLTALKTILLVDQVYKEVHGLGLNVEVNYGKTIRLGNKKWSLGRFANKYRTLEQQHGTLIAAVLSEESFTFLKS